MIDRKAAKKKKGKNADSNIDTKLPANEDHLKIQQVIVVIKCSLYVHESSSITVLVLAAQRQRSSAGRDCQLDR